MSTLALRGEVSLSPTPSVPVRELTLSEVVEYGIVGRGLNPAARQWKIKNLRHLFRGLWRVTIARKLKIPHIYGQLCWKVINPDGSMIDYGLVSLRVITVIGATALVQSFGGTNSFSISQFNYHAIGVGGGAESIADVALGNELAGFYSSVNSRAAGVQTAYAANTYRSLAAVTINSSVSVTEHGLFSQAGVLTGSPAGGIILDRSLVNATPVLAGAAVQSDYRLIIATGV